MFQFAVHFEHFSTRIFDLIRKSVDVLFRFLWIQSKVPKDGEHIFFLVLVQLYWYNFKLLHGWNRRIYLTWYYRLPFRAIWNKAEARVKRNIFVRSHSLLRTFLVRISILIEESWIEHEKVVFRFKGRMKNVFFSSLFRSSYFWFVVDIHLQIILHFWGFPFRVIFTILSAFLWSGFEPGSK